MSKPDKHTMKQPMQNAIVAALPSLRKFAISLCHNPDQADDLVQETMVRALAHLDTFTPGTTGNSVMAWLCTILRNHFLTEYRKRQREVEDVDDYHALMMTTPPEQIDRIELQECCEAIEQLPPVQRDAVTMVGASGFSYREAARAGKVPIGTMKTRVHRARRHLTKLTGAPA